MQVLNQDSMFTNLKIPIDKPRNVPISGKTESQNDKKKEAISFETSVQADQGAPVNFKTNIERRTVFNNINVGKKEPQPVDKRTALSMRLAKMNEETKRSGQGRPVTSNSSNNLWLNRPASVMSTGAISYDKFQLNVRRPTLMPHAAQASASDYY